MWDSHFSILVAEDDPNDALLMERAIRKAGITNPIQWVADGELAIAYLTGEGKFSDRVAHPFPGCILLDLKMPKKNGFELLTWLQQHPRCSIVPSIVWSSSRDERDVRVAYRLGANCYFVKPNDSAKFDHLVQQLFSFWSLCERPEVAEC